MENVREFRKVLIEKAKEKIANGTIVRYDIIAETTNYLCYEIVNNSGDSNFVIYYDIENTLLPTVAFKYNDEFEMSLPTPAIRVEATRSTDIKVFRQLSRYIEDATYFVELINEEFENRKAQ